MASTGNQLPTVGANVDRAANTAWTNPGNVVSDNATDATVVVPSDYLVTSGYPFSGIPDAATILGVTVRVEASESGSGTSTYVPQLHSDTTPTLIGAAKSAVTVSGATKVISTNGGTADLWSATLTPAIVKAAGFGVSIWSTDTVNTLAIDFVTIAIEYSIQLSKSYSHVGSLVTTDVLQLVASKAYSHVGSATKQRAVTVGAKAYSHVGTASASKSVGLVAKAYAHVASLVTTAALQFLVSKAYSHIGTLVQSRVFQAAKSLAYSHVATLAQSRVLQAARSLAYSAVHTLVTTTQFIAGGGGGPPAFVLHFPLFFPLWRALTKSRRSPKPLWEQD